MKIEITIPSSCDNSVSKLIIQNVSEGESEVLLTIDSPSGTQDIYVLEEDIRNAILKIMI